MPFNPESEEFYRDPTTIIDSGPDADTVKQGFEDRLEIAVNQAYDDLNLLKRDGMIGVGVPATATARGISRIATQSEVDEGITGDNGPAFVNPETLKVKLAADFEEQLQAKNVKFDNTVEEGEEPLLQAENVQEAIEEVAIKLDSENIRLLSGRRFKRFETAWKANTLLEWQHNLGLTPEELEKMSFRIDALVTSTGSSYPGGWAVGDICKNVSMWNIPSTIAYPSVASIFADANTIKFVTAMNYYIGSPKNTTTGTGFASFHPNTSKLIINIWY